MAFDFLLHGIDLKIMLVPEYNIERRESLAQILLSRRIGASEGNRFVMNCDRSIVHYILMSELRTLGNQKARKGNSINRWREK